MTTRGGDLIYKADPYAFHAETRPSNGSRDTLLESAERYGKSPYGQHLKNVADGKLKY